MFSMNLHFGDSGQKGVEAVKTQRAGEVSGALDTPHFQKGLRV